jgi:hypothetical protein
MRAPVSVTMLDIRSQLSVVPFAVRTRLGLDSASKVTGGMLVSPPTRPLWSIRSSQRPVCVESAVAENVCLSVHRFTSCHLAGETVVSHTFVVTALSRLAVQKVGA